MKILIIEDDKHKLSKVVDFIESNFPDYTYEIADSYSSAVKALLSSRYDLSIIDMTLPTYSKSSTDSGGRLRSFGGKEIIRQMTKRSISVGFIILTQFTSFSDGGISISTSSISNEIKESNSENFICTIVMDALNSKWKNELREAIKDYFNND